MADRGNAQILIGGVVPKAEEFLGQVRDAQASLEWGDASFEPETMDEVMDALCVEGPNDWIDRLVLVDNEARGGMFDELEAWLKRNKVEFDRYSGPCGEAGPDMVRFRKRWKKVRWYLTTIDGEVVLAESDILRIISPRNRNKDFRRRLREAMGTDIPPVPKFSFRGD